MIRTFLLLGCLAFTHASNAQIPLQGDINTRIANHIASMPGNSGDDYTLPSSSELLNWSAMVDNILNANYATAASEANQLGYTLYAFTDTASSALYYLLEEQSPQTGYWGVYVFNPTPCSDKLVIQSPHGKYDTNTGVQGAYVFHQLDALAFMVNGTHRCNHSSYSSCSGTTGSCGASSSFRISDMAHNDSSIFQITTEAIKNSVDSSVFIQLHGFSKSPTDPYVIISNGTRETPLPDPVTGIKDGLYAVDTSLTFKIAHIDTTWTRLIAFTNTQGRMLNNSTDPCNSAATSTTGRFIHIEQEKTKLRQDTSGWDKIVAALDYAFPCITTAADAPTHSHKTLLNIYPNPMSDHAIVAMRNNEGGYYNLKIFNLTGRLVKEVSVISAGTIRIDKDNLTSGIYVIQLLENEETVGRGKLVVQRTW